MNRLQTILQATLLSLVVVAFTFAQDLSRSNVINHERAPYQVDGTTILQWDDGVNFDAIGIGGGTFEVSARFPASMVGGLAGMVLDQVEVYIFDLPNPLVVKIYDQGTSSEPGALLYSEDFASSAVDHSWNIFTLASPITLSGDDIWVGYEVTSVGSTFPPGVDDGPAVTDGDWINFQGVWEHLVTYGLSYNWNIHAYVNDGGGGTAIVFEDNFDSYTAGEQLACQNPVDWTTWSLNPCSSEDGFVSDAQSFSSPNSVVIVQNNDQIKTLGDKTSGKWEIDFMVYIPQGKTGYFNTLSGFTGAAYEWAMEVYFNAGGAGSLNAGGTGTGTFTWVANQWKLVQIVVDLNNDMGEFWYDGSMVHSWMWTAGATGGGAALQLAANDFFGATAGDEMYFDNYQYIDLLWVPVELTSFTATSNNNEVELNWSTATETNNQGFEVERRTESSEFRIVGFINGKGTTTEQQNYSFVDKNVEVGNYTYRLKQIDFNGQFEYSNEVEVEISVPAVFALDQNYPNPFNPATIINYSIPEVGFVKLAVFNLLGEKVADLVNQVVDAGSHQVTFNASSLPSGAYFYKIDSGNFTEVKKMLLTK